MVGSLVSPAMMRGVDDGLAGHAPTAGWALGIALVVLLTLAVVAA